MLAPDKSPARRARLCLLLGSALVLLASCNRLMTPPAKQVLKDAETKTREGEFLQSVGLYESALDGSASSAEIHYRLALLYDDKMNDPFNAMHHLKRYLTLAPNGAHATEVKNSMKRDELALVTQLSGDSVVSRGEAARLKNENLKLQKQLEDRRIEARTAATVASKEKHGAAAEKENLAASKTGKKKTPRTYVVREGDTLASISRRFYKTSSGWKKIRTTNGHKIEHPSQLKPGETLTIP
ncbi:MAG: LysM peptidoglycan-binding domain-containing protein [Chthoniobacterales bacterium]